MGNLSESGDYVTRSITAGANTKITITYDALIPGTADVKAYVQKNVDWQLVNLTSGKPIGENWIAIIVSTIIGAITILSACQAIESYSVIKNSNKVTSSLHEIKEAFTGKESELFIEKVLSIGTGRTDRSIANSRRFGKIGWIKPLLNVMFASSLDAVNYQLDQVIADIKACISYLFPNGKFYKKKFCIANLQKDQIG